jgi:hypothetical protein
MGKGDGEHAAMGAKFPKRDGGSVSPTEVGVADRTRW